MLREFGEFTILLRTDDVLDANSRKIRVDDVTSQSLDESEWSGCVQTDEVMRLQSQPDRDSQQTAHDRTYEESSIGSLCKTRCLLTRFLHKMSADDRRGQQVAHNLMTSYVWLRCSDRVEDVASSALTCENRQPGCNTAVWFRTKRNGCYQTVKGETARRALHRVLAPDENRQQFRRNSVFSARNNETNRQIRKDRVCRS